MNHPVKTIRTKKCNRCNVWKLRADFQKMSNRSDWCKLCIDTYSKTFKPIWPKECFECKKVKTKDEFYYTPKRTGKRTERCKTCIDSYYEKKTLAYGKQFSSLKKECTKCKQTKPKTEFSRKATTKDGYLAACKKCTNKKKTNDRYSTGIDMSKHIKQIDKQFTLSILRDNT